MKHKVLSAFVPLLIIVLSFGVFSSAHLAEASTTCSLPVGTSLQVGMTDSQNGNTDISCMQQLLAESGYTITADGYFGSNTQNVLEEFQTKNNLTADGVVGPETLAALNNVVTSSGSAATVQSASVSSTPVTVSTPITSGTPSVEVLCPNGMSITNNCALPTNGNPGGTVLCANGMTLASDCQTTMNAGTGTAVLCPNGMTLASDCASEMSLDAPAESTVTSGLCPNGMTAASDCTISPNSSDVSYPAGCTSSTGFSTTTGEECSL